MKTITVRLKDIGKGYFRFAGIASSETRDTYGEIIRQRGINLSLVPQGKVIITPEHEEFTIGKIDHARLQANKLYVEGTVYLKHPKAIRFFNILKKNDQTRPVTLSIEFVNPEYSANDRSILNQVILTGVALVGLDAEPANPDTYVNLLKSVPRHLLLAELIRRSEKSESFRNQLIQIINKSHHT